jgi:hypothetical protein
LDAKETPPVAAKAGDQRLESRTGRRDAAQYIGTSSRADAAQHAAYNRPLGAANAGVAQLVEQLIRNQ